MVKKVLDNDPAFVSASERQTIWSLWVARLKENLSRSVGEYAPALEGTLDSYLAEARKVDLVHWLSSSGRERQPASDHP